MGEGPCREASSAKAYEPKRGDRVEVWHTGTARQPEGWRRATVLYPILGYDTAYACVRLDGTAQHHMVPARAMRLR
jgi:hypothetical protein